MFEFIKFGGHVRFHYIFQNIKKNKKKNFWLSSWVVIYKPNDDDFIFRVLSSKKMKSIAPSIQCFFWNTLINFEMKNSIWSFFAVQFFCDVHENRIIILFSFFFFFFLVDLYFDFYFLFFLSPSVFYLWMLRRQEITYHLRFIFICILKTSTFYQFPLKRVVFWGLPTF